MPAVYSFVISCKNDYKLWRHFTDEAQFTEADISTSNIDSSGRQTHMKR